MLPILSAILILASPILWWCLPAYERGSIKGLTYVTLFGLGIGIQLYLNQLMIYFYFVGHYWR